MITNAKTRRSQPMPTTWWTQTERWEVVSPYQREKRGLEIANREQYTVLNRCTPYLPRYISSFDSRRICCQKDLDWEACSLASGKSPPHFGIWGTHTTSSSLTKQSWTFRSKCVHVLQQKHGQTAVIQGTVATAKLSSGS